MLFNSIHFALFLPITFILYFLLRNKDYKFQNLILLLASYYFYANWDWRFLFLLLFSTLLDYYTGIKMHQAATSIRKKTWFIISISANIGFLGFFKYFNFFSESFSNLLQMFGLSSSPLILNIILPVGISFYTFHGLSYLIDIYKNKITPEREFVTYSLFVSFFPLLVAGPIERATHLLPQLKTNRKFDINNIYQGLNQIVWGLFKKIAVADICAEYVNQVYANYQDFSSFSLIIAAILFSIQIYCDFSGYSDIALGTARLFGVELLKNFSYPYFSKDVAEFWRRWHISLTNWFKDYLYIPLGGSMVSINKQIRNTFIIFIVSGFWHGANWTFITWGCINAILFIPILITNKNRKNLLTKEYKLSDFPKIILTFLVITFTWIFFRSKNINESILFIKHMVSLNHSKVFLEFSIFGISAIIIMFVQEWFNKNENYGLSKAINIKSIPIKWSYYTLLITFIIISFTIKKSESPFIYFQF